MFNLKGPQWQNPRTTCGPRTTVSETLVYGLHDRGIRNSITSMGFRKPFRPAAQSIQPLKEEVCLFVCLFLSLRPPVGQGLFIHEVSGSHINDAPQSVALLWTSDQLVAETST